MKLMRIGQPGAEVPHVRLESGEVVDVSTVIRDFDAEFFGGGGLERLASALPGLLEHAGSRPIGDRRVGAPMARPHQILCIGLNYSDHAAESGMAVPDEPILFTKSPNTLVGPDDDVIMPKGGTKLDWEVELGIVVGARCSYVESDAEAEAAIAGYVLVNDVSERAFQLERAGQWAKGKSAETFNPAGPWIATPDELGDVLALSMRLDVNGERRQTGSTATMIFSPATIVRYLSQFMVLEPGDLINTGTPPGVGLGMTPPTYLEVGDVMDLAIDGLGAQHQRVAPPRAGVRAVDGR